MTANAYVCQPSIVLNTGDEIPIHMFLSSRSLESGKGEASRDHMKKRRGEEEKGVEAGESRKCQRWNNSNRSEADIRIMSSRDQQ